MAAEYEDASLYALNILNALYARLSSALKDEFSKFCTSVDEFYASPQSRDYDACVRFRSSSINARNARCDLTMRSYIHAQNAFTKACYQHAMEHFKSKEYLSASECYSRLRWAYAQTPEISSDHDFWDAAKDNYSALVQQEQEWEKVIGITIKKHWRPIRILHGDYGDYDDCVGYDEEFGEFLMFSPDDNYYHWSGYTVGRISQEYAEELTGMSLCNMPAAPASPYYHSYFLAESPEVKKRIITLRASCK